MPRKFPYQQCIRCRFHVVGREQVRVPMSVAGGSDLRNRTGRTATFRIEAGDDVGDFERHFVKSPYPSPCNKFFIIECAATMLQWLCSCPSLPSLPESL